MLLSYFVSANISLQSNNMYKRPFLYNWLEINSKTTKLQKLLLNNIKPVNQLGKSSLNDHYIDNTIIGKILHRYWTEYVYISLETSIFNSVENIVYKNYLSELSIRNNRQKHLFLKKYLVNEKLTISYLHNFGFLNTILSVKYIHKKYVNRVCTALCNLWKNKFTTFCLHSSIAKVLKTHKFPVFVVVNNLNEIVIGEPEHIPKKRNNITKQSIGKNNYQSFYLDTKITQVPSREGYIFISVSDALEYYNYLRSQYPYSFNELKLKIFIGNLQDYYIKNKKLFPVTQFRLLPDLEEVGKLITSYQYNNNIRFSSKQIHNKNYFQGQPIYFIEPVMCTHVDKLTKKVSKRYFPNLLSLKERDYSNIFTTKEDALFAWTKYRHQFDQYLLPKHPKLLVYNLESFLKDCAQQKYQTAEFSTSFYLVPSYHTYCSIKNSRSSENLKFLQLANKSIYIIQLIEVFIKRILWGMLKWYPPVSTYNMYSGENK
uniref:Uncharacterized protein n=1 Tax=Apophlaea sinclairii TaxID=212746 RepID=A0A1C9CBN2_9FLOR|nr:hypothetical protein Apop_092 [Apophlaea sinclairii]AOM65782.1 hypothetical protein Apop_092 [Apophlaea sinclairii]